MPFAFDVHQFLSTLLTLFVILDPPGLLPVFVGLTRSEAEPSSEEGVNVAIVPLGTPLLAGPGAIVATMLAVQHNPGLGGYLAVGLALVTAMGLVYLFLRFAGRIRRLLRRSGTVLASRIAGLLLAAIAAQMMADGVQGFIRA